MRVKFSKIHGLGNDFIVLNELKAGVLPDDLKPGFSKAFSRRKFGVGSDGVLVLEPSKKADFRMMVFNADGGRAEECFNGLRCVSLEFFLATGKKEFSIETDTKTVKARIISFDKAENLAIVQTEFFGDMKVEENGSEIEIDGEKFSYNFVNVGNPHAVIFTQTPVEKIDLERIGHKIEYHGNFAPGRTNTEFVNIVSDRHVRMRVHERGDCETLACGSGSVAIVLAGIASGKLKADDWIIVSNPGGDLKIRKDGNVLVQGPAQKIFEGELDAKAMV